MPIRPENKNKYPKNWKEIRERVLKRARNRCEFCGAKNYKQHPITKSKVILTIAHLDDNPKNSNESNLKALCQRCHNRYDIKHRIKGMKRRKLQNNKKMINKGYPEKKTTELNENEKKAIRDDIRNGEPNVYILAKKYNCSPSQIAGIKARMS